MSGATCSSAGVKFVKEPSSYIVCQLCKNVFTNPAINVKCGHTYCMTCLTKPSASEDCVSVVRCPEDGTTCNVTELVLNRLIFYYRYFSSLLLVLNMLLIILSTFVSLG